MMQKITISVLAFCVLGAAQAEEVKNFSVSAVSAATVLSYKGGADDDFSGFGTSFFFTIRDDGSKQWAGRASYAYMSHDNFSSVRLHATDFSAVWGSNLNRVGFKWGIGGGLFNDKVSGPARSFTFNGLQLTGGLGYNWDSVSLALWMNLRPGSAYKGDGFKAESAANVGLELGFRF
ncbi:MAG: hypothetical protein JJU30_11375 [Alkalimonas sp.]|nr:hypothetical protein [Alkalimonas sp.]